MAKLPNAPLQEVIFEVRWALKPSEETGQLEDDGFELASGRLSTILEEELPYYKRIVPSDIPEQLLFYRAVHQYWKGEKTWPVVQLGPGMFTVNCTEEWYDWEENYFPFLQKAIQWLIQAYRQPLHFAFVSLRYIDAIKVADYGGIQDGWQAFIGNQFNFLYSNEFNTRGRQRQVQINQVFELENQSSLQIQISDGKRNNELALIWQTAVLKKQLFSQDQLIKWADEAHALTHQLFKEMIKPELYASFSRKNKN
jgi:uncharacterized protein (TIGR04255 family)